MKIGIFTECYRPVMNGVVVSIDSFRQALEERGHEVFIFAPDNPNASHDDHVFRFPSVTDKKKRLYPFTFPSLQMMKSYLPEDIISELDIIHTQHMFTMGRIARYVAKTYKKPLIMTYHTLLDDYACHYGSILAPFVRRYLKNMTQRFAKTVDYIITPSNSMRNILVKDYGIKTPIEPIMTGIDPKAYQPRRALGAVSKSAGQPLKSKYKIPENKKILLYLSRIAKEKNIGFLLKAFLKIKKSYPDCHLVMVGGGPEEEWCKSRIQQLRIQNSVTMTGMLPKEEANKMFGLADIFTFPSITETQGIVVTEAMASGAPPVAVGIMGPTDLVHDGEDGFLTELNVNDFAEKVLTLLKDDNLRQKFAQNGLKRVDEFSVETSTKKLIDLYERAIKEKAVSKEEKAGALAS